MKLDRSYGMIPLKKIEGQWYTLMIKHQRSAFWGFPKGHANEGELPFETALRELFEETGLVVKNKLKDEPLTENYQFRAHGGWVDKTVEYYIVEVEEGDVVLQHIEVEESCWLPLKEAELKATFEQAKAICREACIFIK